MKNRENISIDHEQILNSKDLETRETFPTLGNCTGKLAMTSRIMAVYDVTVMFLDAMSAIYTAAVVNMKPYTRLNNQWDSHNWIAVWQYSIRRYNVLFQ